MARIGRIYTDIQPTKFDDAFKISDYPFNPCHPCSIKHTQSSYILFIEIG